MNIWESIILGLIQGLTEFLPVSSSGHLIIIRELLDIPLAGSLTFDVFLNTATLIAVLYCFSGDIKSIIRDFVTEGFSSRSKNLIYALIVGTIPAGFLGFFYGDKIEGIFRSGQMVALALILGSIIMFLADRVNAAYQKPKSGITPSKGFLVGVFQALALMPGISRSGSSISGGLFVGLSREEAIRFSFLLLIPVSLGAMLKVMFDITTAQMHEFLDLPHILAFLVALISGIWAVRFLVRYLSKNSFTIFIIYRLILAAVIILVL